MNRALPEPLASMAATWRAHVRVPRRRALVAASALVVLLALLGARAGSPLARWSAASSLVVAAFALAWASRRERAAWDEPRRAIRRLAGSVDADKAGRALRALGLLDAADTDDAHTSRSLAELHVRRTLDALPKDRIASSAARLALRLAAVALVFAGGVLAIAVTSSWKLLEGADVLLARDGVAPVAMTWLEDLEIVARPPEYLREDERVEPAFGAISLPRGTLLTFRGTPLHAGRRLVLTDGDSELPFVDDGNGRLVARWPLTGGASLRVVARFGSVAVVEPEATKIVSIEDQAPLVHLEDAPKRIELARAEDTSEIPIKYEATDDHGLREVHLVLRAGAREERRVLARLDGETRFDRGGHVLRATDAFIKRSHVPVEVRVEAKDNDPITGPKWGASESFTIVPPDVGEPEAMRLDALRKLRDALVDSLAWRMAHDIPTNLQERKAMLAEELKGADENAELVDATRTSSFAGVRIPPRYQAMLRGQMRKVRETMNAEAHTASLQTHAALIKVSEHIVLVVDGMIHGTSARDTRAAAKQLADVADDLALGASQADRAGEEARGQARMEAATRVLEGGARSMYRLGGLGLDLGEIVTVADLPRVARARGDQDLFHAELAARDLANRLRDPVASFGGQSQRQQGGGESGGAHGSPEDEPDEESEGSGSGFDKQAAELQALSEEHASGVEDVDRALSGASSPEELKQLADEAKKHAEAVREAVRELPTLGGGADSSSSKSAAAREHAEQMAHALEQPSPSDAVTTGRHALRSLDDAKRAAQIEAWGATQPTADQKRIEEARKKLEPEVAWAEQALEVLRKKAAERAKSDLARQGNHENEMAERTRRLGEDGKKGDMPSPAIETLESAEKSMHQAADALHAGEADRALDRQRDAQRDLENAKQAMGEGDATGRPGEDGNARDANGDAAIPDADAHKGPEEFRKRVSEGLSQPSSGRLKDAVRRYAEGLLR